MLNFILDNIGAICSVLSALVAGLGSLAVVVFKKNTKASAIYSAVQIAIKSLPSLIGVSESVNANKSGETKKAFVMTWIENTLAGRGIVMTDAIRATISENIDAIVAVTKEIHTEKKESSANEENIGNDASGASRLRVVS